MGDDAKHWTASRKPVLALEIAPGKTKAAAASHWLWTWSRERSSIVRSDIMAMQKAVLVTWLHLWNLQNGCHQIQHGRSEGVC